VAVIVLVLFAALFLMCERGLAAAARRAHRSSFQPGTGAADDAWQEEVEQLLVASRTTGLVDQREYQEAMARLAGAEDARSPLRVPELRGE